MVVFWRFPWVSGRFNDSLPLWGDCLAILLIVWHFRPFSCHFGDCWVTLAPCWQLPVSPSRFCPFPAISVRSGGFPVPAQPEKA